MPFSNEDNALMKNVYQFEKYSFQRILMKFLKINCKGERLSMSIAKTWKAGSSTKGIKPVDKLVGPLIPHLHDRANIEQTSSKRRANIELARPANI